MIAFRPMSLTERIKRLWPPYRRRKEEQSKAALRELIEHPEMPCVIGDTLLQDGYGGPMMRWNPNTDRFEPYNALDDLGMKR